jgi:hypothetical protein
MAFALNLEISSLRMVSTTTTFKILNVLQLCCTSKFIFKISQCLTVAAQNSLNVKWLYNPIRASLETQIPLGIEREISSFPPQSSPIPKGI